MQYLQARSQPERKHAQMTDIFRRWPLEQPDTPHAWLRPVSAEKVSDKLHYMPMLRETAQLLPAYCGRLFNPGFARPDSELKRCFRCERRVK